MFKSFYKLKIGGLNEISNKLYNTSVILDDTGKIQGIYDKIHLFEANLKRPGDVIASLKESDYTFHGSEFYLPIETPVGIVGTCIVKASF